MTWSLELRNGDLTLDGTRLGKVSATDKLTQDLRCAILTRLGFDDMHPTYGSLIDGGVRNGKLVPSLLATTNWERLTTTIESEVRRIISDHQKRQLARSQDDSATYGHTTLDPGEVLLGLDGIDFLQANDALLARVRIKTARNAVVTLNVPLSIA